MNNSGESKQDDPSIRNRRLRRLATVAAPLLVAVACSSPPRRTEVVPPAAPTTTAEVTTTTREQVGATIEQTARNELKYPAIQAASALLNILANPNSGTEGYNQYIVGNKAATIGSDGTYPSPDDSKYRKFPETGARYYPETGEMDIWATAEYDELSASPSFTSVEVTFLVNPNNPLARKTEQLTVADFRQALSDPDNLTLRSAGASRNLKVGDTYDVGLLFEQHGIVGGNKTGLGGGSTINPLYAPKVTDPAQLEGFVITLNQVLPEAAQQLVNDTK